jgi:ankyrin repeat protein
VLLAHGADVNTLSESEQTPLHRAAWRNRLEVAKVLLAHGAAVNASDVLGRTPLYYARDEGHRKVEALLLRRS